MIQFADIEETPKYLIFDRDTNNIIAIFDSCNELETWINEPNHADSLNDGGEYYCFRVNAISQMTTYCAIDFTPVTDFD